MKTVFKATISAADLRAALAADRAADTVADNILAAVEMPLHLGLDQKLRHLSGQVRRQRELPRDAGRDGRFLLNLEHALRDLAVRAPVTP